MDQIKPGHKEIGNANEQEIVVTHELTGVPGYNKKPTANDYAEDLVQRNYKGLITIELIYPSYMSAEEQEEAYYDLPPATPDCSSIPQRLSLFGVNFYREKLAPVIK